MSRLVVQDPLSALRGALVRPSARPQDTFIQPHIQQGGSSSGAAGLGSALSSLMKGLDQYSAGVAVHEKKQQEVISKEQLAAGEMAYEQSRKRLGQAVRDGEIPAGASPAFRDGYARSQLRALGTQYDSYLQEAFAGDPSMAEDTAAWSAFEHATFLAFGQENFAGSPVTDAQILKEFMPSRAAASEKVRNQVIKRNVAAIEAQRRGTLEAEVASIVFSDGADSDAAGAGAALSSVLSDYYADYPTKEQGKWLNDLTIGILYQKSLAVGDASVLQVARNVRTGTGKLSDTAVFKSTVQKLNDKLLANDRAEESHQWKSYNHYMRRKKDNALAQYGRASTDEEKQAVIADITKYDPRLAGDLEAGEHARKKRANDPVISNRDVVAFNVRLLDIAGQDKPAGERQEEVARFLLKYESALNKNTVNFANRTIASLAADSEAERVLEQQGKVLPYQQRPLGYMITHIRELAGANHLGEFQPFPGTDYRALASSIAVVELTGRYYDLLSIASDAGTPYVHSENDLRLWLEDQVKSFYPYLQTNEAAERFYRQKIGNTNQ